MLAWSLRVQLRWIINIIPAQSNGLRAILVAVERGRFLDWETFRSFEVSLGTSEVEVQKRYQQHEDTVLTYHGKKLLLVRYIINS